MLNSAYTQTPTPGDARERGQQKGFTLLEVVVATAIAGLALAGLFKAGTAGVFAGNTASRVEEAVERAQSHLAAFGREGAVVASELEGEDGGGYRWRLRAIPLVAEQPVANERGDITDPVMGLFASLTTRRIGTITPQTR